MIRKTLLVPAVLLVILNLVFTSCGARHTNNSNLSPSQTFTAFRDAVKKGDVEGVKGFLSKKSLKFFEDRKGQLSLDEYLKGVLRNLSEGPNLLGNDDQIVDESIDGDKASVSHVDRGGMKWPIDFGLVKEDGQWRVVMLGTDK